MFKWIIRGRVSGEERMSVGTETRLGNVMLSISQRAIANSCPRWGYSVNFFGYVISPIVPNYVNNHVQLDSVCNL